LIKVYNSFQDSKKLNFNHNKKEWKALVKNLDCNIVEAIKCLNKKYQDLLKKHPFMWKTIIDTVYPEYLHKEIEK